MTYYSITFPFHTTLIVKSPQIQVAVAWALFNSYGIETPSGAIMNPQTYISLEKISNPDPRQLMVCRELEEVLLG